MHFGTFYDCNGEIFDSVHFPNIATKYPFRGRGFYRMTGKVTEDFGVFAIEVADMEKMPMINKREMPVDMASRSQLLSGSKLNGIHYSQPITQTKPSSNNTPSDRQRADR